MFSLRLCRNVKNKRKRAFFVILKDVYERRNLYFFLYTYICLGVYEFSHLIYKISFSVQKRGMNHFFLNLKVKGESFQSHSFGSLKSTTEIIWIEWVWFVMRKHQLVLFFTINIKENVKPDMNIVLFVWNDIFLHQSKNVFTSKSSLLYVKK